jgi:hypothetical protein
MINSFVHSYKRVEIITPVEFSFTDAETVSLGVETVDGEPYYVDYGDGKIFKKESSPFENIYTFSGSGNLKLYVKYDNLKTFITTTLAFDFNSSVLSNFNNLKKLKLNAAVTVSLNDIPNTADEILITGDDAVVTDSDNINLNNPMQYFGLSQGSGTALTGTEVDNLLEELSLVEWVGRKQVVITGINSARTSSSDGFVTTLEGKGVAVITN